MIYPNIPNNKPSPRMENGILCWTEGDTFDYFLQFDLVDQDGEAVTLGNLDLITVEFFNRRNETVKRFEFSGETIVNNTVDLRFGSETSDLFAKRTPDPEPFWYRVTLDGENQTTLVKSAPCVVD